MVILVSELDIPISLTGTSGELLWWFNADVNIVYMVVISVGILASELNLTLSLSGTSGDLLF